MVLLIPSSLLFWTKGAVGFGSVPHNRSFKSVTLPQNEGICMHFALRKAFVSPACSRQRKKEHEYYFISNASTDIWDKQL